MLRKKNLAYYHRLASFCIKESVGNWIWCSRSTLQLMLQDEMLKTKLQVPKSYPNNHRHNQQYQKEAIVIEQEGVISSPLSKNRNWNNHTFSKVGKAFVHVSSLLNSCTNTNPGWCVNFCRSLFSLSRQALLLSIEVFQQLSKRLKLSLGHLVTSSAAAKI